MRSNGESSNDIGRESERSNDVERLTLLLYYPNYVFIYIYTHISTLKEKNHVVLKCK